MGVSRMESPGGFMNRCRHILAVVRLYREVGKKLKLVENDSDGQRLVEWTRNELSRIDDKYGVRALDLGDSRAEGGSHGSTDQ